VTDNPDDLRQLLAALTEVESIARWKAGELRHRPEVVSAEQEWTFCRGGSGHVISLYVEIEVPEGYLTWALELWHEETPPWTLHRALTRNVTREQEEVYAFHPETFDEMVGLARRLPEAARELLARDHEATT